MTTLPPELVLSCLSYLDPNDDSTIPTLLSVSLASRTLHELARAASLWRPILATQYARRNPTTTSTRAAPFETFKARTIADTQAKLLVRKLQEPLGRLGVMQQLRSALGSDVVEVLQGGEVNADRARRPSQSSGWCHPAREPESYLSLAYWSEEARRAILRDEAIEAWNGIAERDASGQEREDDFEVGVNAYGAFRGLDPHQASLSAPAGSSPR